MEINTEKSTQLAEVIEGIKVQIHMGFDLEYAEECLKAMRERATRAEVATIFLQEITSTKIDHMATQALALQKLIEFVKLLKEADVLKLKMASEEEFKASLMNTFSGKA